MKILLYCNQVWKQRDVEMHGLFKITWSLEDVNSRNRRYGLFSFVQQNKWINNDHNDKNKSNVAGLTVATESPVLRETKHKGKLHGGTRNLPIALRRTYIVFSSSVLRERPCVSANCVFRRSNTTFRSRSRRGVPFPECAVCCVERKRSE